LPRFRIDQLMAFAWKFLLPLAIVNFLAVALEVLIWREYEVSAGIVLPIYAVINLALTGALIAGWGRVMSRQYVRLPRRARVVQDIEVTPLGQAASPEAATGPAA
jgi:hypothetical protein